MSDNHAQYLFSVTNPYTVLLKYYRFFSCGTSPVLPKKIPLTILFVIGGCYFLSGVYRSLTMGKYRRFRCLSDVWLLSTCCASMLIFDKIFAALFESDIGVYTFFVRLLMMVRFISSFQVFVLSDPK